VATRRKTVAEVVAAIGPGIIRLEQKAGCRAATFRR
jgi:hypothetical protein